MAISIIIVVGIVFSFSFNQEKLNECEDAKEEAYPICLQEQEYFVGKVKYDNKLHGMR
ncbi:MAG: hypothetical protein ACKPBH_21445 [Dolichospermum sp.]